MFGNFSHFTSVSLNLLLSRLTLDTRVWLGQWSTKTANETVFACTKEREREREGERGREREREGEGEGEGEREREREKERKEQKGKCKFVKTEHLKEKRKEKYKVGQMKS